MNCVYKNRIGASGESIARNFLTDKNYKFIKNNFRFDRAEVDLIFEDVKNKLLVFVEVKTRRSKKFGEPEESITHSKQENIRKAALGFISSNMEYAGHDLRIDVIGIFFNEGRVEINHIENAF
ncbi:MAG: YraN family protein [bacterium]